jgi:D-glutamate cyclase
VITDEPCADVTRACQVEMGLADPVVLPVTATEAQVAAAVGALGLAHLVAVERLGPNRDGRVMTMRAVDITASTAPLHAAFSIPGLGTGAVGDGGNEIGMANVPVEVVAGTVDHGADIACRTAVDDLVVAGTSNWGCYGLVAGLAVAVPGSRSRLKELLAPAVDTAVLAAATAAGGIDGVRGVPSASVDGVDADSYGDLLDHLGGLVP